MSAAIVRAPIETTSSDVLQIDVSGALRSARYGDIYFNARCGAEESMHVFIEGNGLPDRWRALFSQAKRGTFVIGELGFGSGLNFLASARLWLDMATEHPSPEAPTLYYYATEAHPLTRTALRKVLAHYNPYPELSAQLLEQYPDIIAGDYLLRFEGDGAIIMLVLLLGDSVDALGRLEHYHLPDGTRASANTARHVTTSPASLHNATLTNTTRLNTTPLNTAQKNRLVPTQVFDAWFLDGFTPAVNPAMWQRELFATIARHSATGSTAATFSVARQVRDNLQACGFSWQRAPGFGRKREMLRATYDAAAYDAANFGSAQHEQTSPQPARLNLHNNAFQRASQRCAGREAIVIGAGIAGCSSAARLAQDGWRVRVLDRAPAGPASGASGNRAAILYARTAAERSTLADWHEAAFHFAHTFYRRIGCAGGLQGMLRMGEQLEQGWLDTHPEIGQRRNVDANEASVLAGTALQQQAIFYAQSGYLQPLSICRRLLSHDGVETQFNAEAVTLMYENNAEHGRWLVGLRDGCVHSADAVVIACAHASKQFAPTRWLPLKAMRGQTTDIAGCAASAALRVPLCGEGYITPAIDKLHACGATYGGDADDTACNAREHRQNIDNAVALLPALQQSAAAQCAEMQSIDGRVSLRCVTPDYLPLLGAVANPDLFRQQFASIGRNARRVATACAAPLPGLYANCGYGSHGFTSAPLLAELLAAEMSGRPVPIADTLRRAVHPSRFLLRELVRGKPAAYQLA